MATRTWNGSAQDGNFSNTANWTAAVVPVTGDSVYVSATATYGMTTNVDRSADNAGAGLDLVLFEVQEGFAYDIGSSGSPLKLTADKVVDRGSGAFYYTAKTGTLERDTDRLVIDKTDISKVVWLSHAQNALATHDTINARMELVRGGNITFTPTSGGTGTPLLIISPRYHPTDVNLSVTGTADFILVEMNGGKASFGTTGAAITTAIVASGEFKIVSTPITTLYQTGGLVILDMTTATGSISVYHALQGFMDSNRTAGLKSVGTMYRTTGFDYLSNPNLSISTNVGIGD